ncbi:hypothetical protein MK852_03090 [Shewanella benthica]|uniref:hypothetical protein n=1 Tax=Moritella sp. TaxID=78556 RepID=UPI00216F5384|nr:hypothetical protein [Moritella sp.]MBL1415745.1 hypothetical protein [Moritella sp.]MCL1061131.1 hypothetical protein [Shewanella benthica]
MDNEKIYYKALTRVAEVFGVSSESLNEESRFGFDLKPSFVSDFKYNELDQINHDIHDSATKTIAKEMEKGNLVIETVKDYCEYMVRCYQVNPKEVSYILKLS